MENNENISAIQINPKNPLIEQKELIVDLDSNNDNKVVNENIPLAIKYAILASCMFVIAEFHIKILSNNLDFNLVLMFSVYRQLGICLTALIYLHFTKIYTLMPLFLSNIITSEKIRELKWFIIRIILLYFGTICLTISIMNIKQMHVILIINLYPIIKNIITPYFLNQKFQYKYLLVTFISFIGIVIMILGGEENIENNVNSTYVKSKFLGVVTVLIFLITIIGTSLSIIILNKEYDSYNLIYTSSFWSFGLGLVFVLIYKGISFTYSYSTFFVMFNGLLNGIFLSISFVFVYNSFVYAEVQKTVYINYIQIPMLSFLAFIFYNETINFQEFIGASVLGVTIFYSSFYMK